MIATFSQKTLQIKVTKILLFTYWYRSGVFIVDFEQTFYFALVYYVC